MRVEADSVMQARERVWQQIAEFGPLDAEGVPEVAAAIAELEREIRLETLRECVYRHGRKGETVPAPWRNIGATAVTMLAKLERTDED